MKKFYFLILFMCLAIGNAWADNGFELLGIKPNVASGSTGSWPASSLVSGATGTITYTPNTQTLTFDNVKIQSASHGKQVVYNKSVSGLTIVFKGECILFSTENIIKYDAWTIVDGSASTKVEMHVMSKAVGDDKETIYSNRGASDVAAPLTIRNFPYLRLTAQGDYCISHKKGSVTINDSHILMESGKGMIHTNYYNGSIDQVEFKNCWLAGNYVYAYSDDAYDVITRTNDTTGKDKVKKAIILRDSEYTGVRLNGEAVLTTDSRWNASSKTLTFNASLDASSNYTYPGAITVEKPDVTIDGGGKSFTGFRYGMRVDAATTTVKNIGLTGGTSCGIYAPNSIPSITVGGNVVLSGPNYGIYHGNYTFNPPAGQAVMLVPKGGTSFFNTQTADVASIKVVDCNISPTGITTGSGAFLNGSTPYTGIVTIQGWQKYNLYVNGTQVSEGNKDNLTKLLGSSATGTLKYNPSTNTLTMNNLKAAPSTSETKGTLINAQYYPLTIVVEGENQITASSVSTCIYSQTNLTITKGSTSTSKLTLKGSPKIYFIQASSPTIKDVTLAIEGNGNQHGIENYSTSTTGIINNATITIKNTSLPLSGTWATSGVYGNLQRTDGPAITIHPSTKQLVYFYANATSPSTDVVTEAINIYPTGPYTMTVNGSKPQAYKYENGVCFDEFSRRLYLRNTSVNGKIEISGIVPTIYTIGDCSVTSSECPFKATGFGLTFTGPGALNLTTTGDYAAADIIGYSTGVTVKNTTLNLKGGKYGMLYTNMSQNVYPNILQVAFLNVINSKVEAHCNPGNYVLYGFSMLAPSDCVLYIPQNGTYYNAGVTGFLLNADNTPASDMLILLEAPQGDLNVDGKVDIADVVCVLDVMAVSGYDSKTDLNGDGKVDIADVVAVLDLMAKQKS
jgi:hypothetical protein